MKRPVEQLRALVDRLNKQAALRPAYPTGGDMRQTEEALGTGAEARTMAAMRVKKAKKPAEGPVSIAKLQKQMY